jgi:DNA-binding NarL/FixJ family response regulator
VEVLTTYGALTCLRKEAFRRAEFRRLVREALAGAGLPATASSAIASGTTAAVADARVAVTPARAGAPRALVVEDDAGWRSIIAELLHEKGLRVDACRSYGEALGMLRQKKYVLAVVDLTLSSSVAPFDNTDGLRLLDHTGKAGVPAIVVSGSAWPAHVDQAFEHRRIVGFLEKRDFDRHSFTQTVERALAMPAPAGELDSLTEREREVLKLLGQGLSNKEIADALVISENTVKRHLKAIFAKLDVSNRASAVARLLGQ